MQQPSSPVKGLRNNTYASGDPAYSVHVKYHYAVNERQAAFDKMMPTILSLVCFVVFVGIYHLSNIAFNYVGEELVRRDEH